MGRPAFKSLEEYRPAKGSYTIMPFRFARIPNVDGKILLTSEVGEFTFADEQDVKYFVRGTLDADSKFYSELQSKHFLAEGALDTAIRLMAAKYRTKKSAMRSGPALHIFVVSLRCDHSCPYCQVSRQSPDKGKFDISEKAALAAVDRLFESPSPDLTVEFQGGEPLLAFEKIKLITEEIVKRNEDEKRNITFTITTTLHFVDDEILEFFKQHNFQISTSLDGPEWLHNKNRPKREGKSYERTIAMLEKTRSVVGIQNVSALTTLTKASLEHPKEIIDEYVRLDFRSIFLRPLSPYGFAVKSERKIGYNTQDFLAFYDTALAYIIELNRRGIILEEAYTAILLNNIFSPFPAGYVDLRSPTGSGLGVLVYNYDGAVYASDESRMLAEMGDTTFRLGNVFQPYSELIQSEAMELLLATGVAESLPGCSDCAFLPYCGADPVFHLARQDDPVGHRPTSEHCIKHTHLFNVLFKYLAENDAETMRIFWAWVTRQSPQEIHSMKEAA